MRRRVTGEIKRNFRDKLWQVRLGVSQMQVSRLRRVLAYRRDRISGAAAPPLGPPGAGAGSVTGAGPNGGPVPRRSG